VIDDDGNALPGVYVTGWIKRGPRGVIGTNRNCAAETVGNLLDDFDAGLLARDVHGREQIATLLAERGATPIGWDGWRAIDAAERKRGAEASRPRVKFVDMADLVTRAEG
jgi:ferredoxin--NADP+ reductase